MRAEYGVAGTAGLRVDYDPFGQPEAGAGLGAPADYGFTGEPRDSATGLVQLRARWYAPGKGQFASRDPFAGLADAPQSYAPYSYAQNDPINDTDRSGRLAEKLLTAEAVLTPGTYSLGTAPTSAVPAAKKVTCLDAVAGVPPKAQPDPPTKDPPVKPGFPFPVPPSFESPFDEIFTRANEVKSASEAKRREQRCRGNLLYHYSDEKSVQGIFISRVML